MFNIIKFFRRVTFKKPKRHFSDFIDYNKYFNSLEWRDEMIKAIDETIEIHEQAIKTNSKYFQVRGIGGCPLCRVSEKFCAVSKCTSCIWNIIDGKFCNEEEYLNDKLSIKRLKRWKRILKAYS